VVAWFSRACYVRVGGDVIALVGPEVNDGPIHLVLDEPLPEVAVRSPARFSTGQIEVGPHVVGVSDVTLWRGALPEPGSVRAAGAMVAEVAGEVAEGSLLPRGARVEAGALMERDDLEGAARVLAGLGPGLTPSGDDVLGGVLFARRAFGGPSEEARLTRVAEGIQTNAIARAFLRWAARGRERVPTPHITQAAVRGDRPTARRAARALAAVGESSGVDFALGLRWGIVA
jgi:hypothetical protein